MIHMPGFAFFLQIISFAVCSDTYLHIKVRSFFDLNVSAVGLANGKTMACTITLITKAFLKSKTNGNVSC